MLSLDMLLIWHVLGQIWAIIIRIGFAFGWHLVRGALFGLFFLLLFFRQHTWYRVAVPWVFPFVTHESAEHRFALVGLFVHFVLLEPCWFVAQVAKID